MLIQVLALLSNQLTQLPDIDLIFFDLAAQALRRGIHFPNRPHRKKRDHEAERAKNDSQFMSPSYPTPVAVCFHWPRLEIPGFPRHKSRNCLAREARHILEP